MINTSNWNYFFLEEIFERIEPTKGTTTSVLLAGNEIPYICASKKNNGFDCMVARNENEQFISKGNCIVLIQIGAGGAGYATYQDVDFIGMAGKTIACYARQLNKERGLFLATLLSQERFRYCYGRSWTGERLSNTKIKLPVTSHNTIDWEWIDSYMLSIYLSAPTSKNLSKNGKIDISKWQEFSINELFSLQIGKSNDGVLQEGEDCFYLGAKKTNNGVMRLCKNNPKLVHKGNCLVFICNGAGSVGYSLYMDKPFIASTDLVIGYNINLNCYSGMFLVSILDKERPRYSYGRKWKRTLPTTKIKLPAIQKEDGTFEPDWQYMENYIKSLPYGDCI